ncbi:MAG: thioredoxin domain-containing protein [Pelagibacteraceae bacterium]
MSTIFLFLIFLFAGGYYFLFLNNSENELSNTTELSQTLNNEDQNSNVNLTKDVEEYEKIIQIDTSEFLKKNEIDLSKYITEEKLLEKLEDFIVSNPQFIIDVLRNYQKEQNLKEQEKKNSESLEKISFLNSQEHLLVYGNLSSTRVIYEFIDYNCGYCLKFHQELMNVLDKDKNIKVVFIQMPILGSQSDQLSKMAIAANLQNKFKVVHDYLYSKERKSNMEDILADLFLLNVDIIKLQEDTASDAVLNILNKHDQLVKEFQFTGTPAIIIGNTIIPGFIEEAKIFEILEKEFS